MAFDPNFRMLFESGVGNNNLNRQIVAELSKLDGEAAQIRASGGAPMLELKEKVDTLRMSVMRATIETIDAIDGEIEAIRTAWETDRDRKPELELVRIRRGENVIGALTDAECADLALRYAASEADLDLPSLNALRARLRSANADAENETLTEAIRDRRGDRPWICDDDEARELADYRDALAGLEGGQVLYKGSEGMAAFEIGNLIDYDGELDAVKVE